MTNRNWCFTLNNPKDDEYPESWPLSSFKLLVYQVELAESGTLHLQGYAETVQPVRLAAMKKISPKAHWEKRMGTRLQAVLYCVKQESRLSGPNIFTNNGWLQSITECENWVKNLKEQETTGSERSKLSTKLRLSTIKDVLSDGCSSSIEKVADDEFDLWVRYSPSLDRDWETLLLIEVEAEDETEVLDS